MKRSSSSRRTPQSARPAGQSVGGATMTSEGVAKGENSWNAVLVSKASASGQLRVQKLSELHRDWLWREPVVPRRRVIEAVSSMLSTDPTVASGTVAMFHGIGYKVDQLSPQEIDGIQQVYDALLHVRQADRSPFNAALTYANFVRGLGGDYVASLTPHSPRRLVFTEASNACTPIMSLAFLLYRGFAVFQEGTNNELRVKKQEELVEWIESEFRHQINYVVTTLSTRGTATGKYEQQQQLEEYHQRFSAASQNVPEKDDGSTYLHKSLRSGITPTVGVWEANTPGWVIGVGTIVTSNILQVLDHALWPAPRVLLFNRKNFTPYERFSIFRPFKERTKKQMLHFELQTQYLKVATGENLTKHRRWYTHLIRSEWELRFGYSPPIAPWCLIIFHWTLLLSTAAIPLVFDATARAPFFSRMVTGFCPREAAAFIPLHAIGFYDWFGYSQHIVPNLPCTTNLLLGITIGTLVLLNIILAYPISSFLRWFGFFSRLLISLAPVQHYRRNLEWVEESML